MLFILDIMQVTLVIERKEKKNYIGTTQ